MLVSDVCLPCVEVAVRKPLFVSSVIIHVRFLAIGGEFQKHLSQGSG